MTVLLQQSPGIAGRLTQFAVVTALAGGVTRYWMRELLNGVSRWVEFDLRNRFFDHLLRLDAHLYGRHQTGEIGDLGNVRLCQRVPREGGDRYRHLLGAL